MLLHRLPVVYSITHLKCIISKLSQLACKEEHTILRGNGARMNSPVKADKDKKKNPKTNNNC